MYKFVTNLTESRRSRTVMIRIIAALPTLRGGGGVRGGCYGKKRVFMDSTVTNGGMSMKDDKM